MTDGKIAFCIRVHPSDIADAERILAVQEFVLSPTDIIRLRTDFPRLIPLMRELKRLYPLCLRDAKEIAERIMSS